MKMPPRPRRPDGTPLPRAEMTPEQRRWDNLARRIRKQNNQARTPGREGAKA